MAENFNRADFGSEPTDDSLAEGFISPPDSAKPRVWWHWMNGNISKDGIEKDLQWMKRVGIGGLQNFDVAFDTPQVVEERLIYMTPSWQDAFRYATKRAHELGLEFAIASSPGWSETGGPWVEPKDGMKKLVWSETQVEGGRPFNATLAAPPSASGPFQSLPSIDLISQKVLDGPKFYADVAVIAYRTPRALLTDPKPVSVSTSAPEVTASSLLKAQSTQAVTLPIAKDQPAWVLYDYGRRQHFRAVSLSRPSAFSMTRFTWVIEASDDAKHFSRVAELSDEYGLRHTTVAFPEIVARFLRLTISAVPGKHWFDYAANAPGAGPDPDFMKPVHEVALYSLRFYAGSRVHRFEEKAGFAIAPDYYSLASAPAGAAEAVEPADIINLSDKMSADGMLCWRAPVGEWTVLRLGYSLTGKTNHPASPEATGLEVDKLDKRAVQAYLDTYLGNFEKTVGREWMGSRGIQAFLTDSIESQGQNWTPALINEFKGRRGYDPTLWLPALTGVIIGNASRTDRFLWDFRQTLIDLISEAHYGQISSSVHERGLTYYSESLEGYPTFAMGDDLDMRTPADIPMAAIWTNYKASEKDGILNHIVDMLGAASVAHFYGKPFVAVEALTSGYEPWVFHPGNLRPVIDLAFALGINRPVIHTSVHQPVDKKPGMTLGPYGQHFTRHETWAEMAGPWVAYLSRTSYLLQQGQHVADVAWFYGQEGSLAGLWAESAPPDLPDGHGFDFINANMLLNHVSAEDGKLVSPGGAQYRLLYLGGTAKRMTLAVLRRLKTLADQGIAIAGRRPIGSPSLADEGREHEEEYQRLVAALWDQATILDVGSPNDALKRLGLARDFEYKKVSPDSSVLFQHRTTKDGEIYFLTNRKARAEQIEASFRVTGRRPELWHADTGKREAVSWRMENERTFVRLHLEANQSVFVVFRAPTPNKEEFLPVPRHETISLLNGRWELSFESNRGAPADTRTTELGSWSESAEPGIKYFSGVGTYLKTFTVQPSELKQGAHVFLDLGEVHELAEVTLNDRIIGTAWHAPFRLDATDAIKAGPNSLKVQVANLWVNRLIGDRQSGATPVAFTVTSTYKPDAVLRPSGLIGPVRLIKIASGVG